MEINFKASPKQSEAWMYLMDDKTTEIGYGGAAYGGKTYLGCYWITIQALSKPKTRWLIGRESLKNLKRTTMKTLFIVFAEAGLKKDVHYNYNQQDGFIKFFNDSEIVLMDISNQPSDPLYTSLGSLEITGAFIDEANECPWDGVKILKTRIGRCMNREYNITPKLLECFNPDKGHVYQRYYKPWRDKTLRDDRAFIQALPKDNPNADPLYLANLENSEGITKQRLWYGNFEYDDDPNKLIEYDAICEMFTLNTGGGKDRYLIIDVARFGKDTATFYYWEGLQCKEIKVYERSSIEYLQREAEDMCNKYFIPRSNVLADEDGVGGGFVDNFRCKGFVNNSKAIQPPSAKHDPLKKLNFANLKTQCAFLLADHINERKIGINPTKYQEVISEELEQIKQKDFEKEGKLKILSKDEMKENLMRSPDHSDNLLMRMFFEIKKPVDKSVMNTYDRTPTVNRVTGKPAYSAQRPNRGFNRLRGRVK